MMAAIVLAALLVVNSMEWSLPEQKPNAVEYSVI